MRIVTVCWVIIGCLALPQVAAGEAQLQVYAAASLQDAVRRLCDRYAGQEQAVVRVNTAASGVLASQILRGAPADLFVSANRAWMDTLCERGAIQRDSVSILAGNRLVVVTAEAATLTALSGLTGYARIAVGNPRTVPAGQYAMQALQSGADMQAVIRSLVYARDVRDALHLAVHGIVPAAIVYQSDATTAQGVHVAYVIPQKKHEPIVYLAGVTRKGGAHPQAAALLRFMRDAGQGDVWRENGFIPGEPVREEVP